MQCSGYFATGLAGHNSRSLYYDASIDGLAASIARTERMLSDPHSIDYRHFLNQGGLTPSYQGSLSRDFVPFLRSLNRGSRWLDVGAGRVRAMLQYLQDASFPIKVQLTAVVLDHPAGSYVPEIRRLDPTFRYLEGRFEDIEPSELGRFELITDVFGPGSVAPDAYGILMRELNALEVGTGVLFLNLQDERTEIRVGRERISFADYIRRFGQGIEVVETVGGIAIRRTAESIQLARLQLTLIVPERPPFRVYQVLQ